MKIIVFSLADGVIQRNMECPEASVEIQCSEGEWWIEHEPVDDAAFKVDLETLSVVPIGGAGA